MSQVRAKVPPTLAAEPTRRRPNVGEVLIALQARTALVRDP